MTLEFFLLAIGFFVTGSDGTIPPIEGFGSYPLWRFNKYSGLVLRPVPLGLDIGVGIPPPPPMYPPGQPSAFPPAPILPPSQSLPPLNAPQFNSPPINTPPFPIPNDTPPSFNSQQYYPSPQSYIPAQSSYIPYYSQQSDNTNTVNDYPGLNSYGIGTNINVPAYDSTTYAGHSVQTDSYAPTGQSAYTYLPSTSPPQIAPETYPQSQSPYPQPGYGYTGNTDAYGSTSGGGYGQVPTVSVAFSSDNYDQNGVGYNSGYPSSYPPQPDQSNPSVYDSRNIPTYDQQSYNNYAQQPVYSPSIGYKSDSPSSSNSYSQPKYSMSKRSGVSLDDVPIFPNPIMAADSILKSQGEKS